LLIGWVLNGAGSWDFGRAKLIVVCLFICWAWWCISAVFAPLQLIAWSSVEAESKILLPFLVGMTIIRSERQLKMLAWVLMLSQAFVAWELNLAYLSGFNRLTIAGFGGMDNNCVSIAMVTGAGLAFFLGLYDGKLWRKWFCFGAAALMAHVPMFGFSRGGMLGLVVTGVMTFLLTARRPRHFVFFLVALAVGFRLAGPDVMERFTSSFVDKQERDASAQSRLDMWWVCAEMTVESPLVGIGPNHFPSFVWKYRPEYERKESHSLWLQQLAELGIPGGLSLMGLFGLTVLRLWQRPVDSNAQTPWCDAVKRMVTASLTGFAVSACFVSLESLELPYYIALLGAATVVVSGHKTVSPQVNPVTSVPSKELELAV
jgi:probable O-glycosylation ligase (exosortase A-associated)